MRRTQKLLITSLVVGASVLLILWNTSAQTSQPALGVADAKRQAPSFVGQSVAVRGSILAETVAANGSLVESFVLADGAEQLLVHYGKPAPEGFGPKEVVVKGVLRTQNGTVVLEASSLQIGCSSKY